MYSLASTLSEGLTESPHKGSHRYVLGMEVPGKEEAGIEESSMKEPGIDEPNMEEPGTKVTRRYVIEEDVEVDMCVGSRCIYI